MKKTTEAQMSKKGMRLAAAFGAVTLIALGAVVVGLMNPKDGKTPGPIDLNATPAPEVQKQAEAEREQVAKQVTPMPTAAPKAEEDNDRTQQKPPVQTADGETASGTAVAQETAGEMTETAEVLSPDGVIRGLNFSAETGMLWPVTGEALLPFSPDHAVYHKTLDSYRTSDAVYLESPQGTHVAAAADGIVTAVREELKTGLTVTMRVSEEHEIVYGMLSDVTVKEGDYVDAGTVFATVAAPSRYYAEDGTGVYVQVLCQGEAVNPMLFLR